ncbi:arsenite efflux transporter metallochaperone ArsD [Bacillus sp. V33-4]|uniref:arsenite efflux transporter metallochaperone ArsD n=1 Tax=Bacillus sp. V33-4 TaxID=2054169 RepID=UPI000C76A33C|nr:arsenite efflux transporter metallochaperone ArsD [Bacillus sp. V33-4]PLR85647.1 arsenical resistance operon transcriptional repressor ArsD [Bacillus sp. V33-4]
MKKLEVFDPAMCCPTGVCGPSVDPELTRIASALFLIEGKGFTVKRYNLASEPDVFIDNAKISQLLNEKGPSVLPIVLFNDVIVKEAAYPTNDELAEWFEMDTSELSIKKSTNKLL